MLKIVSKTGEWNIIIEGIEYNFYYSDTKPIKGLILNGLDTQQEEYQIGNNIITAVKENDRYILSIRDIEEAETLKWVNELKEDLQVGDLVVKNFGSFQTSLPYVITKITNEGITARLLHNEKSKELIKKNKNYASRELEFNFKDAGSFPTILKEYSSGSREENLLNVWK